MPMQVPKFYFHVNVAQCLGVAIIGYVAVKYLELMKDVSGVNVNPLEDLAAFLK